MINSLKTLSIIQIIILSNYALALAPKTNSNIENFKKTENNVKESQIPLFLFIGKSNSGKTTMGTKIGKLLNIPFLSSGEILRKNYFNLPKHYRKNLSKNSVLKQFFAKKPIAKKGLIVDMHYTTSIEKHEDLPPFLDSKQYYLASVVYINATTKTAKKRFLIRNRDKLNDNDKTSKLWEYKMKIFHQYAIPRIKYFRKKKIIIEITNHPNEDMIKKIDSLAQRLFKKLNLKQTAIALKDKATEYSS